MKLSLRVTVCLIVILFSGYNLSAQCPSGNVTLSNQTDINNFSSDYPSCTSHSSAITIAGTDITNLDGLSGVTSVGSIEIGPNPNLVSISGLSGLTSVTTDIIIDNNPLLTDIDAFTNLTSIGGRLNISNNAVLDNLDGLSNIVSANNLTIVSNANLDEVTDYCGLWTLLEPNNILGLTQIRSAFFIGANGIDPSQADIAALGAACPPNLSVVPTMSEWGVVILFILLLIFATVVILSHQKSSRLSITD